MNKKLTLIILFLIWCVNAIAQDTHYWSDDYSTAGFIVPGAVIANNRDSSVLFYNPALLAFSKKNSASFSGNLYQLQNIYIKNGVGKGKNLSSTNPAIIPQIISGVIHIKGDKPFTIGYALTHNDVLNYNVSQQKDGSFNVLSDSYSPGPEYFLGQYQMQNRISETSGIFSAGFKLADNLALGFNTEGTIHNQFYDNDYSARAFINDGSASPFPPYTNTQESYLAKYTNIGIRFKAGLSYDLNKSHLGILITSPQIHLYGQGSILSDYVITDLHLGDNGPTTNLLANSRQTGLKAMWKTPFSAALGYAYDINNGGQLYFAGEYFTGISEYANLNPTDEYFVKPVGSTLFSSDLLELKDARKSVIDFGFGYSFLLAESVTGYVSARLDQSYADKTLYKNDLGYEYNTTTWNNYDWGFGANFKRRKFNLRAGLLFTYGQTNKYLQPYNFDSANEGNVLAGDPQNTLARTLSVKLMMAYIYNF
jgi:hypothetical protein